MNQVVVKTLQHFAILAGLGAAGAIIVGILAFVNGFNLAALPGTWQIIAGVLIPLIIAAARTAQTEINNELALQEAKEKK